MHIDTIQIFTHAGAYTSFKSPTNPDTMRVAFCRHNIVVSSVISESLRESDGGCLTQGGGSIFMDQVGVGWVCTIVNAAIVHWMKCAFDKCIS